MGCATLGPNWAGGRGGRRADSYRGNRWGPPQLAAVVGSSRDGSQVGQLNCEAGTLGNMNGGGYGW